MLAGVALIEILAPLFVHPPADRAAPPVPFTIFRVILRAGHRGVTPQVPDAAVIDRIPSGQATRTAAEHA